tara:strand:+ start:6738 stop:7106 length:369 start_codon:yes stop_codon:yes gene_type:complete
MKKLLLLLIILFGCSTQSSKNKVGMQFLLDVKYPQKYENAYQEYRENIAPILNGAEMYIAKIDGNGVQGANYINLVTAKNEEHLNSVLEEVLKSKYHSEYHLKIGKEKGDVIVISTVRFEFK